MGFWEFVLLDAAAFLVVGLLLNRKEAFLLPLVGWPLFYGGLRAGWWGYGVGDGWTIALMLATLAGLAGVGAGLALRALLARRGAGAVRPR